MQGRDGLDYQQIKVSIVMPVFNAEVYLRECLDKVCRQTLQEYELICVDDCSTDNSLQILQEYQKRYPQIRIECQSENMGSGAARNKGIAAATGEYIAFMDADDYYHSKDSLRILYQKAAEHGADICGGGMRYVNENKDASQYCFKKEGWIEFRDYQQYYYYQRFIYRRSMLIEHRIEFPDYLRFQDPPFFVRAMLAAGRFYALKDTIYVYRENGGHVKWNERKVNDLMKGNMELVELCMEHGLDKLLYDTLKRNLENNYFHGILEGSLSKGNTRVADFYHYVLSCVSHPLLQGKSAFDLEYARGIDGWDRRTNMSYVHRSLELIDQSSEYAPCVSVVIPVYNTEKYVSATLDSIVQQTLSDIEIICIDDGSTDNSAAILNEYAEKYSNIRVYHQENQGLSAARNAGMQHVRGDYVYFMDSDDLLDKNALEELYSRAKMDDLDIVFFGAKSFFDEHMTKEEKEKNKLPMAYHRKGIYERCMTGTDMFCAQISQDEFYTPVWIQLVRTAFLREQDIGFYEYITHEDNLYTVQILLRAQRTGCMDEHFFKRRIRSNSIMTTGITYRNLLGLYLSLVEMIKEFKWLKQRQKVEACNTLVSRMQGMVYNNMVWKWAELPNAQRALFFASLTQEDRMDFDYLMQPAIDWFSMMFGKTTNSEQRSAHVKTERMERTVRIPTEIKALRMEVEMLRTSNSYRIGRCITWLPRQIKRLLGVS